MLYTSDYSNKEFLYSVSNILCQHPGSGQNMETLPSLYVLSVVFTNIECNVLRSLDMKSIFGLILVTKIFVAKAVKLET